MGEPPGELIVLERVETPRGELVLRRVGEHLEIISNGTFLMDTRDGRSERLLATAALAAHPQPATVLVLGLGVGTTLDAVLADARATCVVVVEVEPVLVRWFGRDDRRVEVVVADAVDVMRSDERRYDVICLDVDNGPDWTVTPGNGWLYGDAGTAALLDRLAPGGVLAVWSAQPSPAYEARLRRTFAAVDVHEVPAPRGDPDVVYVCR